MDKIKQKIDFNKVKALFIFVFVLILLSPIMDFFGITVPIRQLGIIYIIAFLMLLKQIKIRPFFLFIIFLIVCPSFVVLIHFCDIYYLLLLSNTLLFALVFCICDNASLNKFVEYASTFLIILEVLAIIGFIYAWIGGSYFFSFPNPDKRTNYVFPFTFSNAYFGNLIRPSGIYDEPGAFVFFIVSISILRIHYNKNPKTTLLLLSLGFITTSLTHILCYIILLPSILKKMKRKERFFFYSVMIIVISFLFVYFFNAINRLFLVRLQIDKSTGKLKGDTRSGQIPNTIRLIKDNGFMFGSFNLSSDYIRNKYGVIGENPFSLLAKMGLFLSIPYYFFIIISFLAFIFSKKLVFICMILLFFQRPYPNIYGYAFFFVYFFYLSSYEISKWYKKSRKAKYIFL